jgi:hypothetical protein
LRFSKLAVESNGRSAEKLPRIRETPAEIRSKIGSKPELRMPAGQAKNTMKGTGAPAGNQAKNQVSGTQKLAAFWAAGPRIREVKNTMKGRPEISQKTKGPGTRKQVIEGYPKTP